MANPRFSVFVQGFNELAATSADVFTLKQFALL
jgi:hypothetical protein